MFAITHLMGFCWTVDAIFSQWEQTHIQWLTTRFSQHHPFPSHGKAPLDKFTWCHSSAPFHLDATFNSLNYSFGSFILMHPLDAWFFQALHSWEWCLQKWTWGCPLWRWTSHCIHRQIPFWKEFIHLYIWEGNDDYFAHSTKVVAIPLRESFRHQDWSPEFEIFPETMGLIPNTTEMG